PWPQRPRLRAPPVPLGCRAREIRAPVRENQKRALTLLVVQRWYDGPGVGRRVVGQRRRRRIRGCARRGGWIAAIAVGGALAARTDLVALDHLVQRGRLDVKQFRGPFLHAAGRLERRLDQPFLEVGDHVLE